MTNKQELCRLHALVTLLQSTTSFELNHFSIKFRYDTDLEIKCTSGESDVFYPTEVIALVFQSGLSHYLEIRDNEIVLRVYVTFTANE